MSATAPPKDVLRRPDGSEYKPKWGIHYGWWIFAIIIVQFVLDGAFAQSAAVMYPTWIASWKWTASMIKQPIGYASWIGAGTHWIVGYTWDHWIRYGKMRAIYIVMGCYAAEFLYAFLLAQFLGPKTNWLWWAVRIAYPFTGSWCSGIPIMMATNWFLTRRGLILGGIAAGAQGGTPLVWGWLTGQLAKPYKILIGTKTYISLAGFRSIFRLTGYTVLPIIPVYFFFVRTWPQDKNIRAYGAPPWRPEEAAAQVRTGRRVIPPEWNWGYTLGEAVRTRVFWFLFAGILLSPFFWAIEQSGYTIHGGTVLGLSTSTVGLGLTLYGWWQALQGGLLGHVLDWKGWDKRFGIAWGPFFGVSMASVCLYFWRAPGGYLLGGPLIACGVGAWVGLIAATFVDTFGPRSMGMVWSVGGRFTTSAAVGTATLYAGWLFDKYKAYWVPNWYLPAYNSNIYWGIICAIIICLAAKPSLDMYARLKNPPPYAQARRAELEKAGTLGKKSRQPWW